MTTHLVKAPARPTALGHYAEAFQIPDILAATHHIDHRAARAVHRSPKLEPRHTVGGEGSNKPPGSICWWPFSECFEGWFDGGEGVEWIGGGHSIIQMWTAF